LPITQNRERDYPTRERIMSDTGICEHCNEEFTVTKYGFGLRCPLCKGKIDVFPDDEIFVTLPFGVVGISGLKEMWRNGE